MRKKLSARFVNSIRTHHPRIEFCDTEVEGLILRVTKDATKSWAFRYRRKSDRKRRFMSLGRFPDRSLAEARNAAAEARIAIARGADPAAGLEEVKRAPTFGQLVEYWQINHASRLRAGKVRNDDQSMLDRYILPMIGSMKVQDIKRLDIFSVLNRVQTATDTRKGRAKKHEPPRRLTTRPNRVFELMRAVWRWAHGQGLVETDPTLGMKRPVKTESVRDRELSPAEIEIFWKNLDRLPATPALTIAIKLALVTGQRIGEVCGIAKDELTLDGPAPVWMIAHTRTKNDRGHRVPLSPLAITLIREALALQREPVDGSEVPWVFPARAKRDGSKGPILPGATAAAMHRGRDKLGVAHFCVHDLRRTAASRMAEMGINPYTISLILNHVSASRSTVTSRVYIRYSYDKEKREALDAWSARLENIIAGNDAANVVTLPIRAAGGPDPVQ